MRRVSAFVLFAFSLTLSGHLLADETTPKIDFDQGVDSSAVLRKAREEAKWLSPLPRITIPLKSLNVQLKNTAGVYPPVTPLILNNAAYQNAANLRNDSRYRALPPRTLEPLEAEWRKINDIRRDLLSNASSWEGRNEQLYRDGQRLEQDRAVLDQRERDLNTEIDQYNQECTTRPVPPDEYRRCVAWRDSLIRRSDQLNRDIDDFNREVDAWNSRSSTIFDERGVLVGRINAWDVGIAAWIATAMEAIEGGGCGKLKGVRLYPANPPILSPRTRQPFEAILEFAEPADNPCPVTHLWTAESRVGNIGVLSFPDLPNEKKSVLTTGNGAAQGSVSIEVEDVTNNVKFKATAQIIVTDNMCRRNFIFPIEELPNERWRLKCNYICPPDSLCGVRTLFAHPPSEAEIGFFCKESLPESQVICPTPN